MKTEIAQIAIGTAVALAVDALNRAKQIANAPGVRASALQHELKQVIDRLENMPVVIEKVSAG
jgi:hypothetical protein